MESYIDLARRFSNFLETNNVKPAAIGGAPRSEHEFVTFKPRQSPFGGFLNHPNRLLARSTNLRRAVMASYLGMKTRKYW